MFCFSWKEDPCWKTIVRVKVNNTKIIHAFKNLVVRTKNLFITNFIDRADENVVMLFIKII